MTPPSPQRPTLQAVLASVAGRRCRLSPAPRGLEGGGGGPSLTYLTKDDAAVESQFEVLRVARPLEHPLHLRQAPAPFDEVRLRAASRERVACIPDAEEERETDPSAMIYQNPALLRQHLLLNGPLNQRQRQALLLALMASVTPEQFQQAYQA